jgi:hypothetical protein
VMFNGLRGLFIFLSILYDRGISIREELGVRRDDRVEKQIDDFVEGLGRYGRPIQERARKLVVGKLAKRILEDSEFREMLLQRIETTRCELTERWIIRLEGAFWLRKDHRDELRSVGHEQKTQTAREVLPVYLEKNNRHATEAASLLVRWTVDVDQHAAEISQELSLVPERIVNDKHATYERWDRLNAEGEFRQAIAPPLIGILVVLTLRGVLVRPVWLILAIAPLILLLQGIRKATEAKAQLMQIVEAEVVQIAPVERLNTADLHWNL